MMLAAVPLISVAGGTLLLIAAWIVAEARIEVREYRTYLRARWPREVVPR